MENTIRKMTKEDRTAVLEMMREFYASPAVLSNGSDAVFSSDIDNCTGENPFVEGYILENSGEIQGYAMIARSFSTEFGRPCIWIEDLYVKKDCRGTGAGSGFLDLIVKKNPDCIFRLEAEKENTGAVRLYESRGFRVLPYMEMIKKAD